MVISQQHLRELFRLFATVENEQEAQMLLEDMLTPQELESLAERWQLVQELDAGTPQRDIAEKLGVSISKITRGSRQLQYGEGGFTYFLEKIRKVS